MEAKEDLMKCGRKIVVNRKVVEKKLANASECPRRYEKRFVEKGQTKISYKSKAV